MLRIHHEARETTRCPQHPLRFIIQESKVPFTPQKCIVFPVTNKDLHLQSVRLEAHRIDQLDAAIDFSLSHRSSSTKTSTHLPSIRASPALDLDPPWRRGASSCTSCTSLLSHIITYTPLSPQVATYFHPKEFEETRICDSLVFLTPCGTALFHSPDSGSRVALRDETRDTVRTPAGHQK